MKKRLRKIGINVNVLASQAEARELAGEDAEYSKYRRKNKKDNTEVYQKFRIYTGINDEITSEILKQKNQYNEFDYEVPIGIVNLNGNLYFYQNLDGSDFVVFGTLNYSELSEELEKELIKEIKNGTITSAEDIDKYVERYEDELRTYFEHNDGDRRRRNFSKDNGGIYTSNETDYSSNNSEGSGITWYYRGNGNYEFLRTDNGTIYGWQEGDTITLTPEGINPNTPVHQYTHLWSKVF